MTAWTPERIDPEALRPDDFEGLLHRYRYALAARHALGPVVLDVGCGPGYGSAMLAKAPGVETVIGLDRDETTLWHATRRYPGIDFRLADVDALDELPACDTIVAIEALEHLARPARFIGRCHMSTARRLVLCFPTVPSAGENPHHLHDIAGAQLGGWLPGWRVYHEEPIGLSVLLAWVRR